MYLEANASLEDFKSLRWWWRARHLENATQNMRTICLNVMVSLSPLS